MQSIKNFKDWMNVQEANLGIRFNTYIYQYFYEAPNMKRQSYYEIQLLYWPEDADILTAKASLFKCTEKENGKNGISFERKCILESQPVFECVNTAANDIKLNNAL